VLLALDGPPPTCEPLERAALAALADEFFRTQGSITYRLQMAIKAANRRICQENRRAFPGERQYGGVVCVVLQDDRAYLGQVGPSRAYLSQAGEVQCYASPRPEALLGQREHITVHLSYLPLTPEDRLLLTDRPWGDADPSEALTETNAKAAWDTITSLAPPAGSSAWLIGRAPEAPDVHEPAKREQASVYPSMRPAQTTPHVQLHRKDRLGASLHGMLSQTTGSAWRWIAQTLGEIGRSILPRPLPSPTRETKRRVDSSLSAWLQPYLPPLALGIPLMALLLTGLFYWQKQAEISAQSMAFLHRARQILSITHEPGTDQAAVRIYLQSALAHLDAALVLRPNRKEAQELREKVQAQLDQVDRVTRLAFIRALYQYPHQSKPARVLEAQGAIYVLDRGANRVYRHRPGSSGRFLIQGGTEILLQQGQQVEGKTVGALVDIGWLPPDNGEGRLLVLDLQGTLWSYAPRDGIRALALPGLERDGLSGGWRLASYAGHIYVLAPQQKQVLRYALRGHTLGPPEAYFPPGIELDLTGVSDIGADGYVYLLWAQGILRRFLGGEEHPFPILLPDVALSYTPALFARSDGETSYLYILDAAQRRVVQLTKEGGYVRQLKAKDPSLFTDLRSLYVDEAHGRLLVTDGHRLLLVEIPPLTTP